MAWLHIIDGLTLSLNVGDEDNDGLTAELSKHTEQLNNSGLVIGSGYVEDSGKLLVGIGVDMLPERHLYQGYGELPESQFSDEHLAIVNAVADKIVVYLTNEEISYERKRGLMIYQFD